VFFAGRCRRSNARPPSGGKTHQGSGWKRLAQARWIRPSRAGAVPDA
jgi:hypothetical protein